MIIQPSDFHPIDRGLMVMALAAGMHFFVVAQANGVAYIMSCGNSPQNLQLNGENKLYEVKNLGNKFESVYLTEVQ